jgi:hypothetical protein
LSGNPTIAFVDNDTDDKEDTVTYSSNCTATGTGAENCDVTIQQYVGGAPTNVMVADADGAGDARIVLPDSSIGPDELMSTGQTDGYYLQYESTGDTIQWAVGAGGAFDDSSDPVVMNTTTKDVHFGDGAGTLAAKVEIGGDADQPQLVVEGHSTQTDSVFVIQADDDTEVFTVDEDGLTTIGGSGSTGTISGTGDYVEINDVLYITPAATPPLTCGSSYYGAMYHDTSGAICICNDGDAWEVLHDYTSGTTGACS